MADFFFTSCPGICPKLTKNMGHIQETYKNNHDIMIVSMKKWRRNNPEKFQQSHKKWMQDNKDHVRNYNQTRRALKNNATIQKFSSKQKC